MQRALTSNHDDAPRGLLRLLAGLAALCLLVQAGLCVLHCSPAPDHWHDSQAAAHYHCSLHTDTTPELPHALIPPYSPGLLGATPDFGALALLLVALVVLRVLRLVPIAHAPPVPPPRIYSDFSTQSSHIPR